MTSNKKKKKNGEGEGCHHEWVAAMLVLHGVVATVAGRRENSESELNTWRSDRET